MLESHPLELPLGIDGNIFKGRDSNYYITLLSTSTSALPAKMFSIKVSIKAAKNISKVTYWGPGTKDQDAAFAINASTAEITLPKHKSVSLVKLSIATRRRRPKSL